MPCVHVTFGAVYIEIEDLLHQFSDPNVVDIKMGTRLVTYVQQRSLTVWLVTR